MTHYVPKHGGLGIEKLKGIVDVLPVFWGIRDAELSIFIYSINPSPFSNLKFRQEWVVVVKIPDER